MSTDLKKLQKNWLLITSFVVWSFGPVFFLATMSATDGPARLTLDLLNWPVDGEQKITDGGMRFLSALTGGFLFGWGVMILCLRQLVYDRAPEQTRKSILIGLLAWFFLDSAGSYLSGVSSNVLFNILVLFIAAGPLWRPVK